MRTYRKHNARIPREAASPEYAPLGRTLRESARPRRTSPPRTRCRGAPSAALATPGGHTASTRLAVALDEAAAAATGPPVGRAPAAAPPVADAVRLVDVAKVRYLRGVRTGR